jgi:hypothetical protein
VRGEEGEQRQHQDQQLSQAVPQQLPTVQEEYNDSLHIYILKLSYTKLFQM